MLYVSQIIGQPIFDARNDKIASIKDVLVRYGKDDYPPVIGVVARFRRRNFFIPRRSISELNEQGARMSSAKLDLTPFVRREGEVLLAKDVLDNQLIDVDGKRVVRVNDVQLIDVGDKVVVIAEWRGRGKASGVVTEWRFGAVYTLRDGKVTGIVSYTDPAEALKAVGLSEQEAHADS